MGAPDHAGLAAVLKAFHVPADALLGHGGEARVYALGDDRVLRVLYDGGRVTDVEERQRLVDELARSRPPFALPQTLDMGIVAGRVYAIERRLTGQTVLEALQSSSGQSRRHLIERHLETAAALGDLRLERGPAFGDLIGDHRVTTDTWRSFLVEKAAANLARSTPDLWNVDPTSLADALPDASQPAFVHLDAFAGNVLTDGNDITAVIDISASSIAGDRRLDPLSVAVYLASSEITPGAQPADIDVAMSWLRSAGLDQWFDPARRWLAAFWAFAVDNPKVLGWSRAVLLEPPE